MFSFSHLMAAGPGRESLMVEEEVAGVLLLQLAETRQDCFEV